MCGGMVAAIVANGGVGILEMRTIGKLWEKLVHQFKYEMKSRGYKRLESGVLYIERRPVCMYDGGSWGPRAGGKKHDQAYCPHVMSTKYVHNFYLA